MKIGIFDSGYGGLTILNKIRQRLPQYDYIYLGDNARTPYGTRSFDVVYAYTLQCVEKLFECDCRIVILACNTASAKALRTIQQNDLPRLAPERRVLGVIRPTIESLGRLTHTRTVGLVATEGTVRSGSYPLETAKLYPDIRVVSQACPMWVPLIENNEHNSDGADYFVKKYLDALFRQNTDIDTLILGCTHYPLMLNKIRRYTPQNVTIVTQGDIVADSLADYLHRHPEMETRLTHGASVQFLTTDRAERFDQTAALFMGHKVEATRVEC